MGSLSVNNLRIRTKLILGVGLLLAIIAVVALVVWGNLAQVRSQADAVTGRVQPAVLDAMELARELDAANKSLGYYLLTQEAMHRDAYRNSLRQISQLLLSLQNMPLTRDDERVKRHLDGITSGVNGFAGMQERMLGLVEDQQANQPAFRYAASNLNPYTQEMAHLFSQMVQAERGETSTPERRELLLLLGDVRYSLVNIMSSLRGYLAFRADSTVASIEAYMGTLAQQIEAMQELSHLLTFEQEDALEQIVAAHQTYVTNYPELKRIHSGEQWRTDAWLIRTELGEHNQRISQELDALLGYLRESITVHSAGLMAQTDRTRQGVLVMAILALLVGVFTVWWLTHVIVTPINAAARTMDEIARGGGDLGCQLKQGGQDELGQMCAAFNRFVGKIREIIGPVKESTDHLAESADGMAAVTHQTRQGVQRQQQETEQVAAAMNEMVATAQDMVDSAGMAADATAQADKEARAGAEVVRLTIKQINALADAVEQAGDVIHRLEEDSSNIGKVLDVIGGIAEQTNLLALNAAIEAARAGEQGRGFAVVADEVRNLASRTQDSTSEIQSMIEKLQSGAHEAVTVMKTGREQASSSVEQASHAGESLKTIAEAVAQIRDMNQHMADAARQQGAVAGEINRNLVTITEVAEQTAEGAAELEQASGRLTAMSHQLQSLVGHFKT